MYRCTYTIFFLPHVSEGWRDAVALLALGPWARVLEAQGPRARVLEPRAPGPWSLRPIGLEAPWDPKGRPPWDPRDPPWDPRVEKIGFL